MQIKGWKKFRENIWINDSGIKLKAFKDYYPQQMAIIQ